MDLTDYKILEILQSNGRITMKELGKMVALSAPAVAERVKRLEENGIITGYKAIVDGIKIGRNVNAFINVTAKPTKREQLIQNVIHKNDRILECHLVTGPYSMVLKVSVDKMSELLKLLYEIQIYGETESFIIADSPLKNKIIKPIINDMEV